jgi:hypothetical protein
MEGHKLTIQKVQIEIFEGDPFTCSCAAPRPVSEEEADAFRKELIRRSRIIKEVQRNFSDVAEIRRDVVTSRRPSYPTYVRKAIAEGRPLPYLFANGELVSCGRFPEREELVALIAKLTVHA